MTQDRHEPGSVAAIEEDAALLREQLAIRDAIIAGQQAVINELSAPIIPVSAELSVVPFVGPLDDERIDDATDRILHAVVGAATQVIVIDLTGISSFDDSVVHGLARMVSALRLVGASLVLTGIGAGLALALSSAELPPIGTHPSLQAAIAAHARLIRSSEHHRR